MYHCAKVVEMCQFEQWAGLTQLNKTCCYCFVLLIKYWKDANELSLVNEKSGKKKGGSLIREYRPFTEFPKREISSR